MEKAKSKHKQYAIGAGAANIYALGLIIPIVALYVLPYGWFYGGTALGNDLLQFLRHPVPFLISVIAGTILHELIHAVCWSWLDGIPWSKIKFGVKWKVLTPYVHCPEPVEISHYRWGVAMPGIVLGVAPYALALLLQNGWLLGFGLFFTLAAGGDILILWLLRDVPQGTHVQDHPELVGCRVVDPPK